MMSFGERDSKKIELAVWGSIREMQATQICPRTSLPPRGPRFIGACPGGACLLFPNALVSDILVGIELLLQVAAALRKSAKGLNQIVHHTGPDSSSDYPGFFKDHTCGTEGSHLLKHNNCLACWLYKNPCQTRSYTYPSCMIYFVK